MMATLAKWTVVDYHHIVEAGILKGRQVELLAGEIYEITPEGPPHTFYSGSLADNFRDRLSHRALVREARPITLAESEPEPDIAIVPGAWTDYQHRHLGPADILLLVEVSDSSLGKDLEQKKSIYAAASIPEYWILDLTVKQLIVFRNPDGKDYQSRQNLRAGAIAPLAFPDLQISLSQLFQV